MIASIIILVASLGLFIYWFRYTCLLILSAKTSLDYTRGVALANQLCFLGVQSELESEAGADPERLDRLERSLGQDYAAVTSLLKKSFGQPSVEDLMLKIDYRIMTVWYRVARTLAPGHAVSAASEMCQIVSYFANSIGERAASGAEA